MIMTAGYGASWGCRLSDPHHFTGHKLKLPPSTLFLSDYLRSFCRFPAPEIDIMPPEETVSKSPLDKPLCQLTEDDISQLTREDCRRYLKQKGMRKPSWNKSQAIQQAISLKVLLETTPDTDAGTRKKLHIPRADTHVQRGKNTDGEPSEPVPDGRNQQDKPDLSGHIIALPATALDNSAPSRIIGSADTPVGQMTIFYCGKVNVYDDVPADKAQTIMSLASSPLSVPSETPSNATVAARHSAFCLQTANTKLRPDTDMVPTVQTVKMSEVFRVQESSSLYDGNPEAVESSSSRKASLQRYREKRKDRFKCKRKVEITSSASSDINLNDRMGTHTQSSHSSRADLCFTPLIRLSTAPTGSGPIQDNIQMNPTFSSGLNGRCDVYNLPISVFIVLSNVLQLLFSLFASLISLCMI